MDSVVSAVQRNPKAVKGVAGATLASLLGFYLLCRTQTKHVFEDLCDLKLLLSIRRELKSIESNPHWTMNDVFDAAVKRNPNGDALCFVGEKNKPPTTLTYRELDEASNRVANWAIKEGIKQGDVVGLIMDNRPEFVITWLGICKIGGVTALINTNLVGDPLLHSMTVSTATRFVVGFEHADKIRFGQENLPGKHWFVYGGNAPGATSLDPLLTDPSAINKKVRSKCGPTSDLLYIYTSGTTGNPKAGVIKHIRFFMVGSVFARTYNFTQNDRTYCSLPLYHSAGGMIGVSTSWYTASCLVFRRKFSAKQFWSDIHEQRCTVMQYIGELCRYLLAQPETPHDKSGLRLAVGNGLRPDIWVDFQTRFNIEVIGEFYAATEGNTGVMNYKNRPGAVGYIPPLLMKLYPLEIVKLEDDNETPVRTKNGLCVRCKPGEKGELLGKIDNSDPTRKFDGYTSKEATEKKILRDVVKKGDKYFRSGDLLKTDTDGFFYFVDRLGDTFRWKGENVATSEVEAVIARLPGISLVNVYGVLVPHHDGRAGMAALVTEGEFSFEALYDA